MPRFDSTGPRGMGPMTGGGRGYCTVPLSVPETELDFLKNQAHDLKAQLERVNDRIKNLEKYGEQIYRKEETMKIAISAAKPDADAQVDTRFGRCQYFVIVDMETSKFEALENSGAMGSGGVGISAAQLVAGKGVEAVLTGNCGPNAHQTLSAAGIKVITGVTGSVRDAIEDYKSGKLQASTQPNVSAHSGINPQKAQV